MGFSAAKMLGILKTNWLTFATMFGVIGGVVFGVTLKSCSDHWSDREVMYLAYPGELFLR